jgi:hypothetical protein
MRRALDVGFAGLPLGMERVEFEIKIMLGRFEKSLPSMCLSRAALRIPSLHRERRAIQKSWVLRTELKAGEKWSGKAAR